MDYHLSYTKKNLRSGEMIITDLDGNRASSFDVGIKLTTQPKIPYWTQKVELFTFKSRSGYHSINHGTREHAEMELELTLFAKDEYNREHQRVFLQELQDGQLRTFEFYNDPFGIYEGIVTEVTSEGNRFIGKSQTATMKIMLQPYRLLRSNYPDELEIKRTDKIFFKTGFVYPIFTIESGGDLEIITENNTKLSNLPTDYPVIVDSLEKKTYQYRTSKVRVPRGDLKDDFNYPEIKSGTTINWVGSPSTLKMKLNWRL